LIFSVPPQDQLQVYNNNNTIQAHSEPYYWFPTLARACADYTGRFFQNKPFQAHAAATYK
jgi:hypothetical protein